MRGIYFSPLKTNLVVADGRFPSLYPSIAKQTSLFSLIFIHMENVIEQINKISHLHTSNVLMKLDLIMLKKRNTILL